MNINEIRLKNLAKWANEEDSHAAFCKKAKIRPAYLSQLLNGHRNIGEKTARSIELETRKRKGSMDIPSEMPINHNGINSQVLKKAIQLVDLVIQSRGFTVGDDEKANIIAIIYEEMI